ncbi:MAG: hypothetical protein IT373_20580 [Polyangiaceae bacterium]|nr:hypothetical protein [Polyangiaceae bacterium]
MSARRRERAVGAGLLDRVLRLSARALGARSGLRPAWWLAAALALACSCGTVSVAWAQDPGDPLPVGPPATGVPNAPPTGQETHAASGGESQAKLPTQEPELPENPLFIHEELKLRIGTDADPEYEKGKTTEIERTWYGPYYEETSGDYQFRMVFPFWLEKQQKDDRESLFGLNYYQRRSEKADADVFFPLFWHFRSDETYTTVIPPVMHSESPHGHQNWVAPLFFEGAWDDGSSYLYIPPLLTFAQSTDHDGFQMAGPAFCWWKGGPNCDARTADDIHLGVAPFYFWGRDARREYEVIPPLLHYYEYSDIGDTTLNVWGPVVYGESRDTGFFDVLPLFFHNYGPDEEHTTLFPLFHYGYKGPTQSLLVTPLFLNAVAEDGAETFATYLYARHRGRTELDMVTPLFWRYADPDIGQETYVAFPFVYYNSSPRSEDLAVFPFYGHFQRHGIYDEQWFSPLVRYRTDLTGWETDVLPFFFMGRSYQSTHFVLAPVVWDFASPQSRSTVVFPIFWRFADDRKVSTLVANTYYREEKVEGGTDWEVHFFPLLSFGASPQGHWWNILYGLTGYTREGTMSKMRMLYIPIQLSE